MHEYHQQKVTRRSFVQRTARIALSVAVPASTPTLLAKENPPTASNQTYYTSRRTAQLMTLDAVKLWEGPFREANERDQVYLLSLDPDRFLHYFRTTAGLTPKARVYSGWEEQVGRMLGHYLSACSMYARSTGDPAFIKQQGYIVTELAECQRANGDGYVGSVSEAKRIFGEIAQGNIYINRAGLNGVHAPWYMLHKMCAGLRDAYINCQNEQALAVLTGFSDWADKLTTPLSEADMQKMLQAEHGGMNEIFADM